MATREDFATAVGELVKGRSPVGHTHDDRYQRGTRGTIPAGADLSMYRGTAFAGAWTISDATDHTLIGLPPGYTGAGFMDLVWSHDWAQVQTVTEGTTTRQWVRSLWPNNASPWRRTDTRVKTVAVPLTAGDGGGSSVVGADLAYRLPLNFGARLERFRLRLRNLDYRDSSGRTGAIVLHSVSIGEAARDSSGALTGGIIDGTIQDLDLTGSATDTDELVTEWAWAPLDPSRTYLLTYRVTGVTGQAWSTDVAGGWAVTDPATAHDPAAATTPAVMVPLAVSLDVEAPEATPVYGALGDSLTAGSGSTLPVHDSWIAVYARTHGGLYTMWAAHGDTLDSWAGTADKTWRFSEQARPDVLFMALGSNDVFGGADLPTMQARLLAVLARMRQYTSTNIVLCSILPRDSTSDGPAETVRRQYNDWLRSTLPGGASRYVDVWPAISADNATIRDEYDADGIHLTTAGYAAIASALDTGASAGQGAAGTGWRAITPPTGTGYAFDGTGTIYLRRRYGAGLSGEGDPVDIRFENVGVLAGTATNAYLTPSFFLPTGFTGWYSERAWHLLGNVSANLEYKVGIVQSHRLRLAPGSLVPGTGGNALQGTLTYATDDARPTVFPGSAHTF